MVVVEIRRRQLHDAKSVCVKRRHWAMPAAVSAGEGLQEELAAAACVFCCLLLLLLQVMLVHTRAADDVPERIASQRQRCLKRARIRVYATLGQAWPIQSVRRVIGQRNSAVESHITHVRLYHNMLPKYFV